MITKFNFKDKTIKSYAIRKLTPTECFRLMGVREDVIRVMQSTVAQAKERMGGLACKGKDDDLAVSNSQQYKQAGNSIVVDVLAAIYEQLWFPHPIKSELQTSLLDDFFPEDALPSMPVDTNKGEKVIVTSFSGYDSQLMAADVLRERHPDFRWTCAGWSEIDKYACLMHNIVFPEFADKALGDITSVDWQQVKDGLCDREVDLFTYSSPCQDISQSGKQMGLKEGSGTRSSLLWKVVDAIEVLRPKYLLQENVAALVSNKFFPDFQRWLNKLEQLGYVNRWERLNAKDYGVPQNRDRVFCLSMRRDVAFDYRFPEPMALEKRLADVLESEVSGRYFLKDESVVKFLKANEKDVVVFSQFDIPNTHEAAMFLKTLLHEFMDVSGCWDFSPVELERILEKNKHQFVASYKEWMKDKSAFSETFKAKFNENMYRRNV